MSLAVFSSVSAEFSLERSRECIPKEGLLSSPVLSEVLPSLEPLRSSTVRKLARRGISSWLHEGRKKRLTIVPVNR